MLEEEKKSSNLPTGNPEAGTCSDLGDYDKAIISSDEVETKKL